MLVYGILCAIISVLLFFSVADSVLCYKRRMVGWLMNDEIEKGLERSGRDVIKVLSRPLSGGTEENREIHRPALCPPRF
jgi:hypothetical protein